MERWFLKGVVGKWEEVTKTEWIRAEGAAGFHPKGRPGEPATGGFSGANGSIQGRRIDTDHATPDQYDWDPEWRDAVWPTADTVLTKAYRKALRASDGDSNDREISAWRDLAFIAMGRLGFDTSEIDEEYEDSQ